ncbi:TPA: hypothetical protein SI372_001917 [Escherichia coli]|nr:hypothetical protein [Escherichia coli]HEI3504657.1 hypothetical protein [Escherichia coli]
MKIKSNLIILFIFLFSKACFAEWNVRPMSLNGAITSAVISSDTVLSVAIKGTRTPAGNANLYVCSSQFTARDMGSHVVWFIRPKLNGKTFRFNPPSLITDYGGGFNVTKSEWIESEGTLVLVATKPSYDYTGCNSGGTVNFSTNITGAILQSLPAGTHTITLDLQMVRVLADGADNDVNKIYRLATQYRNRSPQTTLTGYIHINAYCISNNSKSITLNHGRFAVGTGNGREASASIEYECNHGSVIPKVRFTSGISSGNSINICDGLTSVLSTSTQHTSGYGFRTVFKSTLRGNASSSCAGSFSKSVVAVITPP